MQFKTHQTDIIIQQSSHQLIWFIILIKIRPQIWSDGSQCKGCWNIGENDGEGTLKKPNGEIKTGGETATIQVGHPDI